MEFKIGDLVCFKDGSGDIYRINTIKDNKYYCDLFYWRPMMPSVGYVEEEVLRKATLEDWKEFCGIHTDIYEKHKDDFIKGNVSYCINGLVDTVGTKKLYETGFDKALNEEDDSRHSIAKLINSMVDEYDKSNSYNIRNYLFNHFVSYRRDIKDLKEENNKLKNKLINLSNEKNKYKEIAEIFKESGIWDLKTNYDNYEYCLCDSSDGYRTYSLTVEQFYKLEDYLNEEEKGE